MRILLPFLLFILFSAPAGAQYHDYAPRSPSVEVDLSVLDDAANAPRGYDRNTHSASPALPSVTRIPLPSAAPVSKTKKVLKPAFAARPNVSTTPEEQRQPADREPEPEYTPRIVEERRAVPDSGKEPETQAGVEPEPGSEAKAAAQELTSTEMTALPAQAQAQAQARAEPEKAEAAVPEVPSLEDLTLEFSGTSSKLDPASAEKLDGIALRMKTALEGRLQVRAYASGENGTTSSARRIALSRALSVRSYLMDKGIKPTRVDVRALGSDTDRPPVDRVDLIFVR